MNPPGSDASLQNWLRYLESLHPSAMDLGLERVLIVLRRLFPQRPKARIITIAGTNGKGSTAAALEALLRADGRSTGLYTSPHILDYNERIRINGEQAGDREIIAAFQRIEEARRGVSLTYFEFGTLAAFLVFEAHGVEDWVLEVGLGGRLDAVNCLDPDLAIITTVAIDHAEWLGNDRETIGYEKAGILRPGITALYGESDPPASVIQQAHAQKVRLYRAGETFGIEQHKGETATVFFEQGGRAVHRSVSAVPLPLPSVATAIQGFALLGHDPESMDLERVLRATVLPGRFEAVATEPQVILDVAHNPHAAAWLADRLAHTRGPGRTLAVYAGLADKDTVGVIAALKGQVDGWYPALLNEPRALDRDAMTQRMAEAGLQERTVSDSVQDALRAALSDAQPVDRVIVLGSFYTVAGAKAFITKQ